MAQEVQRYLEKQGCMLNVLRRSERVQDVLVASRLWSGRWSREVAGSNVTF